MTGLAIIDFDGTLCNTHDAVRHVVRQTFAHFGAEAPAPGLVNMAIGSGVPIGEVFGLLEVGGEGEQASWAGVYRSLYDAGQGVELTTVYPGVERGLRHLRNAGYAVAILSNKGQSSLDRTLAHFGLIDHVDLVIGASDGFRGKPDPHVYDEIIRPRFLPRQDGVFVIGDAETDLNFARNIGARAVWARYGFGNSAACERLRPDFTIDRFDEFPSCLRLSPSHAG